MRDKEVLAKLIVETFPQLSNFRRNQEAPAEVCFNWTLFELQRRDLVGSYNVEFNYNLIMPAFKILYF